MEKKNFKNENPALAFINTQEPEEPAKETETASQKIPDGYKLNPEFIEKKSKRVQLLLQPSVYEALKGLAEERKQSFNETAAEALKYYLEKEGRHNG